LRLLEGGNESPLAKWNLNCAVYLARHVPGAICNSHYNIVTIPPEVVTFHLGTTPGQCSKCKGRAFSDSYEVCLFCGGKGATRYGSRPAIVISTQE